MQYPSKKRPINTPAPIVIDYKKLCPNCPHNEKCGDIPFFKPCTEELNK